LRILDACQIYTTLAPPKRSVLLAQAQAHYFLKHYEKTVTDINFLVQSAKSLRDTHVVAAPEELLLRMLADSHFHFKNRSGYLESLDLLLSYYPSRLYWRDYLSEHIGQLKPNSVHELDWYRLMGVTQNLQEAGEYMTYAQLALKSGFPREAQRVVEQGIKTGILDNRVNKAASDTLRQKTERAVAEDSASIAILEKNAFTATNGNTSAQLGDLHMANGAWAQAQTVYQLAIEKGGLQKEALVRLRWAISMAMQNANDAAITALTWNGFDATDRTMAKAWTLWAKHPLK
jgi:hypothetical protein